MKNNSELQADVQNAIKWEPLLNATEIEVTVKDGVVSLTGIVDSYVKKMEAENAAKRVMGVKALVENIKVKFPNSFSKSNDEIAADVLHALKTNWSIPENKITVKVEEGWVTLDGNLPWNFEKEAAKKSVSYLTGIKGITNNITIKSDILDTIEQSDIENAISRSWSINDNDIKVKVSGTTVTLSGTVTSWYQKEEAARIAWNTPGIWHIINELEIDSFHPYAK